MLHDGTHSYSIKLDLFDIDRCVFHKHDYKKHILDWLIPTNQSLLDSIILDIQTNAYDKVILALGSNRQDYFIDWSNPGGSCCPVLPIFQSYLQSHTLTPVQLDPILMADLYKNKPAGASYRAIAKDQLVGYKQQATRFILNQADLALFYEADAPGEKEKNIALANFHNLVQGGATLLAHDQAHLDLHKVSLIYAHAHRVAALNLMATSIVIDFYDDNPDILSTIHDFYTKYPDFLPQQVTLRLHHYPQAELSFDNLNGRGKVDLYYTWFMRYIVLVTRGMAINTADDLSRNDYAAPTGSSESIFSLRPDSVNIERLRAFREHELPKLGFNGIDQSQQNAYTTALKLYAEGLIPGEFVLSPLIKPGLMKAVDIPHLKPLKITLNKRFQAYNNSLMSWFFSHDTAKANEIIYALQQCRDTTDMRMVLKLSRCATDASNLVLLIEEAMQAICTFERTQRTAPDLSDINLYQQPYSPIPSCSSRLVEAPLFTNEATRSTAHYSNQFIIFLRKRPYWSFTPQEHEWLYAFQRKWWMHHQDRKAAHLYLCPISPADNLEDKVKYEHLAKIDNHTRITIVGNHDKGSEYFTLGSARIHYKTIIDLLCHHVTSDKVLLNSDDILFDERALRINFISCNIHEPELDESLATKMLFYASHHPVKPLRIELSAPQMYCAPFLGQTDKPVTSGSNRLYSRLKWLPVYKFHKQYAPTPILASTVSAGLFKPAQRKVLLKTTLIPSPSP